MALTKPESNDPLEQQYREVLIERCEALLSITTSGQILLGILLVAFGVWLGSNFFVVVDPDNPPDAYATNLYTELLGVLVTVGIVDVLYHWRDKRQRERDLERELQEQLVRDAGSASNEIAKDAIHQLQRRKWLYGYKKHKGLLRGQDLHRANLAGANLDRANLSKTILGGVNLSKANLDYANLIEAYLYEANLSETNLNLANLSGAHLESANLSFADLNFANLDEADLSGANLKGANLAKAGLRKAFLGNATFDENTTLPDGTKWTLDTDLTRFGAYVDYDKWKAEVRDKRGATDNSE